MNSLNKSVEVHMEESPQSGGTGYCYSVVCIGRFMLNIRIFQKSDEMSNQNQAKRVIVSGEYTKSKAL